MDIIQKAIKKGLHISQRQENNQQSWKEFWEKTNKSKIILFGVGACAGFIFENYQDISIEAVIDNDMKKQGARLDDFVDETRGMECGSLEIQSVEILKKYSADDVSVLISSINYYEQIIEQLELAGIKKYYVALIMEANRRKETGYHSAVNEKQRIENHVGNCCKEQIKSNKILFCSFGTYSDHGKYITEALLKARKDLDLVWLVKDMTTEVPDGVRKVYFGNWKRYIYELETAGIWVYSTPVPQYIIKRQGQIYIQTKHWASITLKRFYLDIKARSGTADNIAYWKQDSRKMDYIITGSDFDTSSSRRGFDFHKEVIQIGSPRSDAMFQGKEKKEKVYSHYGLNLEKHMLLYAPTYRYDKNSSVQEEPVQEIREINLDYKGVKEALEKRFGGEWYIALRLHPGHEKEVEKLNLPEYVIDLSKYNDGIEAAAACDIMISDYSSIMFEPAFVKKPVFLFATDKKDYIDKEYDLLIDYDTLPFPIAESNGELIKNIECFRQADYENKLADFMNMYGVHEDGHASERAAEFISGLINKGEEGVRNRMDKIVLNKEIDTVDKDADIKDIEEKFGNGCSILYVVGQNGEYLGCITRRELIMGVQQEKVVVNYDSYSVPCGEKEEERVREIFDTHKNIYNIPVTGENGLLLYEYIRELDNKSFDSAQYWEKLYKNSGNSGDGSYQELAEFKAEVLNDFIHKNNINSIIEWGFGDGNQLKLLDVSSYTGYDVSETVWKMCQNRFAQDANKIFRHYDGARMNDYGGKYDMAISLDVLYHLVEDDKFDNYLYNLFHSPDKYVCIYSSDYEEIQKVEHVRRRKFTEYVKKMFPEWKMVLFVKNPYLYERSNSNFYFYEKDL